MIAIIEDQHFGAFGDHTRHAQDEAVGVGGSERKLPVRQPKAPLKFLAHPDNIFIRQHERDAFLDLLRDGMDSGFGRVARHRASVAQAQVQIGVAIHVGEVRALRRLHKNRERSRPADHPQHGHAAVQGFLRPLVKLVGFGVGLVEKLFLRLKKLCEF